MKKIVNIILCSLLLFGCSSNKEINKPSEPNNPIHNYDLDYVTDFIVGKWQSHSIDWTIEISEDNTYTWFLNNEEKVIPVKYDYYLESFEEYEPLIQHDPEFSNDYGVHVLSVEKYGDMLVGQDNEGNYKFYFWGQKWTRIVE